MITVILGLDWNKHLKHDIVSSSHSIFTFTKVFLSISISKFTQLLLDLAPEHPDQPDLVPEQAIRQELEIKQAEGQEDGDQVHAEPQCGWLHQAADGAEKVS